MTSTLSIDRASLSLPTLVIPSTGFELGAFDPGGVQWQRAFAESRFVNDAALISARRASTQLTGTIRTLGSSPATLQALEAELVDALSQFSYAVSWTETGTPDAYYLWSCWPADVATPGFSAPERGVWVQEFQVTIPRKSVPAAGSF